MVTKDVKKLRDYEARLLKTYENYLSYLERLIKRTNLFP